MSDGRTPAAEDIRHCKALFSSIEAVLEGKPTVVELSLVALLAQGHLLIEDVPGVGKTTLARALASSVGGEMRRVQFTSDVLPSDVLGVSVFDARDATFTLRRGPIFSNVLLADEINRATPRTQSALLEAMNEAQVSIDGSTYRLPAPFFVIATQNPQDFAGTFPLPESQLDRFILRINIGYPPPKVEMRLLARTAAAFPSDPVLQETRSRPALSLDRLVALQHAVANVRIDPALIAYLHAIVTATRSATTLNMGVSTRGALALARAARARAFLRERTYCIADDIHDLAVPVLAHRLRLSSHADGFNPTREESEVAMREILQRIAVPV